MVALELRIVVEIERQRVVDPQRSEVRERTLVAQTKDTGEESDGCLLVVRRHDRMVEHNCHRHLQRLVVPVTWDAASPILRAPARSDPSYDRPISSRRSAVMNRDRE